MPTKIGQKHGVASFEVVGDKELIKELKDLERASANKVMRPAVNAGLTPIRKRARRLSGQKFNSDTFTNAIKKSTHKAKDGSGIVGIVYIEEMPNRTIKLEGRDVPFHVVANILEFGYRDGTVKAKSFIRQARDDARAEALAKLQAKVKQRLRVLTQKGMLKFQ